MKNHEMNEKNQIKELSREEMRQMQGGMATAFAVEDPISKLSEEVRCGVCVSITTYYANRDAIRWSKLPSSRA